MRSLEQALQDHDILTLRVIGEWWELDLTGVDKNTAVTQLAETLAQVDMQRELLFLPPEEAEAINDLLAQEGRVPVAVLSRSHGDVRLMGPGRMEREEPWLDPVSATEALWYRGFVYRAFDETAEGVLEFYYLPNELLAGFPQQSPIFAAVDEPLLQPLPDPPDTWTPANIDAVDDLTALLALALRITQNREKTTGVNHFLLNPDPERRSLLLTLAGELSLVRKDKGLLRPTRAAIGWLKQARDAQLCSLGDAWSNSDWNDLCHTPGLRCEGDSWQNDPILARTALLDSLPRDSQWYKLSNLVETIKHTNPDFQRPDGNYDTWYIKDDAHDGYLAGFDAWDQVEGRLIHFLITHPLHWLGMIDIAHAENTQLSAFRLTDRALDWLNGKKPAVIEEHAPIIVESNGVIVVPINADRYSRFQVARISEAQAVEQGKPFYYQISPESLGEARDQGIKSERILSFLAKASGKPLPKSVHRAIERWDQLGVEGRLESVVVLRVRDEVIIDTLRKNPRTREYLGESLGALAVVIKPGKWEAFRAATVQLGLLLETNL
ncbi:MAG: helicase-associated domain-containing protein [Candidatus Promineifilaceae bacterium]|nr:helicase-associated domain-containing protein [Candidatus Promineifilaceae bacterium]